MTSSSVNGKPRVCAVSYLNTVPLVWGMLHGPQREACELTFAVPSECAELLRVGAADIGIVSSIEVPRQELEFVPGIAIASRGPLRSILLISRVPIDQITSLAVDASSRTSVALCAIILKKRYGVQPKMVSMPPELDRMLASSDAALLIGDPALRLDLSSITYRVYDLGQEWSELTELPMVYAVWAGRPQHISTDVSQVFRDSCRFGMDRLDQPGFPFWPWHGHSIHPRCPEYHVFPR